MSKSKKKSRCESCGKELGEDEACELNGMILCGDCYTRKKTCEQLKRSG